MIYELDMEMFSKLVNPGEGKTLLLLRGKVAILCHTRRS